jgi:hypothetical protein
VIVALKTHRILLKRRINQIIQDLPEIIKKISWTNLKKQENLILQIDLMIIGITISEITIYQTKCVIMEIFNEISMYLIGPAITENTMIAM